MPRRSKRAAATVAASRIKKIINEQHKGFNAEVIKKKKKDSGNKGVCQNGRHWKKLNRHRTTFPAATKKSTEFKIRRPRKAIWKGLTSPIPSKSSRKSSVEKLPTREAKKGCNGRIKRGNEEVATDETEDYFWRDERKCLAKRRPTRVMELGNNYGVKKGIKAVAAPVNHDGGEDSVWWDESEEFLAINGRPHHEFEFRSESSLRYKQDADFFDDVSTVYQEQDTDFFDYTCWDPSSSATYQEQDGDFLDDTCWEESSSVAYQEKEEQSVDTWCDPSSSAAEKARIAHQERRKRRSMHSPRSKKMILSTRSSCRMSMGPFSPMSPIYPETLQMAPLAHLQTTPIRA